MRKKAGRKVPVKLCHSWAEVLREADGLRKARKRKRHEQLWFRGVRDGGHGLVPSLYRIPVEQTLYDDIDAYEIDYYFEFRSRARELHAHGRSDWDVLSEMRHHGAPTRLLDWTETLAVAAWFAAEEGCRTCPPPPRRKGTRAAGPTPRIWVLDPYELNDESLGSREIFTPESLAWDPEEEVQYEFGDWLLAGWDLKRPVAIYPLQNNARISAQYGRFTIHGTDRRGVEKVVPKAVSALDLTPAAIAELREQLGALGWDEYRVYADLGGLAAALGRAYRR